MASALAGDDLVTSVSSRRSWTTGSFREGWMATHDVFNVSGRHTQEEDEEELKWAAIERLPTFERMRKGVLKHVLDDGKVVLDEVDVSNLCLPDKKVLVDSILKIVEEDNEKFLRRLRDRVDRCMANVTVLLVLYRRFSLSFSLFSDMVCACFNVEWGLKFRRLKFGARIYLWRVMCMLGVEHSLPCLMLLSMLLRYFFVSNSTLLFSDSKTS